MREGLSLQSARLWIRASGQTLQARVTSLMKKTPLTPYQETLGLIYFARMLDKIRLQARGELREDFQANLGKGFDARLTNFLRVPYESVVRRTLEGGSDEDVLRWCYQTGRELNESDAFIWSGFLRKVGWNDAMTETLQRRKKESGLAHRDDVQTMLDYFEADEGRRPEVKP
jgi:hypothetical protein